MARTTAEIKQQMTDAWMAEPAVRERYGLGEGDTFGGSFSKVSIESLLFHTVAAGIHVVETLIDHHRAEVEETLAAKTPHTLRWYRDLVLGYTYQGGSPVSHCSVSEGDEGLTVKIAAGEAGARQRVDPAAAAALPGWLAPRKDAGTHIAVVNRDGDSLRIRATLWRDPTLLAADTAPLRQALAKAVSSLDFDGILTRRMIEDALLATEGVEIVHLATLQTHPSGTAQWEDFGQQRQPLSGWWKVGEEDCEIEMRDYGPGDLA